LKLTILILEFDFHTRLYILYIWYNLTARTGVLPGEVRFDCSGSVLLAFWDVGGMAKWLTRFVSNTQETLNPKPQNLNLT
jgi:hypothetical protein